MLVPLISAIITTGVIGIYYNYTWNDLEDGLKKGVANALPSALTAAAIISGAFFGDKLSPLSDTTNIAAAMTESNLFEHVGHMLWDTIPAFFISLIIYGIIGLNYVSSNVKGTDEINSLMLGLENTFNLNPILFVLPIITIILAVKKTPAIFAANMLGVAPGQFIPFLFFPMLAILFNLIYGITGISIAKTE